MRAHEPGERHVGRVARYHPLEGTVSVDLDAPLREGELLHVVGPRDDFRFRADALERERDQARVEEAPQGERVRVLVPQPAHPGSEVRAEEHPPSLVERVMDRLGGR